MLQEHTKKQHISTKELDSLMAAATRAGFGLGEKESASQYIHTIKTAAEEARLVGVLTDIHKGWGRSVSSGACVMIPTHKDALEVFAAHISFSNDPK